MKSFILKRAIASVSEWATPSNFDAGNWEVKNKLLRLAGLKIGQHTAIGPGFQWIIGLEKNIIINDYAAIGHNAHLWSFNKIEIGEFTTIAADVSITNGWHSLETMEGISGKLKVGRGCWIGMGAKLVGAITIGDNAIIGAGSVVIRDVPPGHIAAGVPARILRKRPMGKSMIFFGGVKYCPKTFELINERITTS